MFHSLHRSCFRFRLRTLLIAAPLGTWLLVWGLTKPNAEVDAWIVLDERRLTAPEEAQASNSNGKYVSPATALKSDRLLARSLGRPGVADLPIVQDQRDAVAWLRDELQVDVHDGSRLVRISLRGRHPDQLAKVLNSIAATYARSAHLTDQPDP